MVSNENLDYEPGFWFIFLILLPLFAAAALLANALGF